MPPDGELAAQGGNNSSDFVRKLYKMLEDPAYSSVVRWGNDGDSFVVLENEKFTKSILPKHFKHSNFASFVRQLNKYDFHKVRQNEENGQSPYPASAWEFKHPEFHKHKKDNLDNIRRKAPAPRKAVVADEAFPAAQQIALLNEALSATQHQVQALQEQYYQLMHSNRKMTEQMMAMHKHVAQQRQIQAEILGHLSTNDERRRNSRHSAHSSHSSHSGQFHPGLSLLPDSADEPAPELRRAKELLGEVPGELHMEGFNNMFLPGSPPDSATSSVMYNQAAAVHPANLGIVSESVVDMRHAVYPVGQTQGIDPMHSDHIHNIPYTRPQSTPNVAAEAGSQITPPPAKDVMLWAKKPKILLVEDDQICARIGAKFLGQVDCSVDTACDGDAAVSKINREPNRYDLIFMDIIMPVFDGVSATACIRMVNERVPIVAMTSNIRGEDIAMYYQWGMNDVLAKPFTREGMIRILKKHLSGLLKNPPPADTADEGLGPTVGGPGQTASTPAYSSSGAMSMGSMGGPPSIATPSTTVKYETTPIQSPATTSSWHSPGQIPQHTSPRTDGGGFLSSGVNSAAGMILTPGGTQRPTFQGGPPPSPMGNPPIRGMPDGMHGDDRPEKRQRLYGPGHGQYS